MLGWVSWPWYWAGAGLALVAALLLFLIGVQLSVSTGYGNWVALLTRHKFFHSGEYQETFNWRFFFLVGLILGGFLSVSYSTGFYLHSDMGMLRMLVGDSVFAKCAVLFMGGIAVGFGTRWARGCPSGHCIFGLGTWSKASWIATLVFFAVSFVTSNILYRLVAGLGN
jgi:uncharacterized membrane protein YedE/YeeE